MIGLLTVLLTLAGGTPAAAAPPVPRVVADRTIALQLPSDVRWDDADHLLVTDRNRGLARVPVRADDEISWLTEWPKPSGPGTRYYYLATSGKAVLVADYVFLFRWRERGKPQLHQEVQEYTADLDLDGKRVLLVGSRRGDDGKMTEAVAWLGAFSGDDASLRPILPYHNRNAVVGCMGFGLGAVRFLHDGSFVVVPGAEPGVYLFSKEGVVQRVWATDTAGLNAPCEMSDDQRSFLAQNYIAREEWRNRHRMVDDVIETPFGPAAIARSVKANRTEWALLFLDPSGSIVEQPLPVSSPSPWAHMAAATRGERVVLVIGDCIPSENGAKPRLILLEWPKR